MSTNARTYIYEYHTVDSEEVSRRKFIRALASYFLWSKRRAEQEVAEVERELRFRMNSSDWKGARRPIGEEYHRFSIYIEREEG